MPSRQMSQNDLQQEIDQLALIIETNQAALRLPAMSDVDRRQLLEATEQRRTRLADLQDQLARTSP